jgi:hypothetical protein
MQPVNEHGLGSDNTSVGAMVGLQERVNWKPHWTIEKYDENGKLYEVMDFDGNLLLNEGITEMLNLIGGIGGTAFSNANAYIGIGESTTAAVATQTGLQGSTKTYKPMDTGYPQVLNQTITYQATYGPDDANNEWQEVTIANGNSDIAKNMNRKVQDMGRKAQGTTWIARCSVTLT